MLVILKKYGIHKKFLFAINNNLRIYRLRHVTKLFMVALSCCALLKQTNYLVFSITMFRFIVTSSLIINSVRGKLLAIQFEKYSNINPGRMVEQSGKLDESLVGSSDVGICKPVKVTMIRGSCSRK